MKKIFHKVIYYLFSLVPQNILSVYCINNLSWRDIKKIVGQKFQTDNDFVFQGERLKYFFHSYNCFRISERTIEIPIIKHIISRCKPVHALEIGNVTQHYYDEFKKCFNQKTVVDKYEQGENVINNDIASYNPDRKYALIFSISTFEHMDSDRGRNTSFQLGTSMLTSVAADNIKKVYDDLLDIGGMFVLTIPLGYSEEFDASLYNGDLEKCDFFKYNITVMRRIQDHYWEQTEFENGRSAEYNYPYPGVNYLSIIEIEKN
ncbi:hypothetical protein JXA32_11530 [Candidatus Sumerlaeota bacterium]|nr:hypothetical protein [Candidatus Sumerlaeota bacterium]